MGRASKFVVMLAALLAASCWEESPKLNGQRVPVASCGQACQAVRALGFRDVAMTGWAPMSCAKDDDICTGFQATAPTGARVEGAVGCGLFFKGCTVRLK